MVDLTGLPPGTILQLLHLERRLKHLSPGRFIEVGPGAGNITALLLNFGWVGKVYDLHQPTIAQLGKRFATEIADNRLKIIHGDFITSKKPAELSDLFISCMVAEHIPKHHISSFWSSVGNRLTSAGMVVTFVPSSPAHWGVEDDIAGHVERYTFESLEREISASNFKQNYICGLTFPVSNFLLPISNYLVGKAEQKKMDLSLKKRTALSGARAVEYKTHFPKLANIILNRWVMKPFDVLQRVFFNSTSSLVIYQEAQKVESER